LWLTRLCRGPFWAGAGATRNLVYATCHDLGAPLDDSTPDLFALAQVDGRLRWAVRSDDANSPPTVANGVVYVGSTTSFGNSHRAFSAGTGKSLGRWPLPGPGGDPARERAGDCPRPRVCDDGRGGQRLRAGSIASHRPPRDHDRSWFARVHVVRRTTGSGRRCESSASPGPGGASRAAEEGGPE
jgi:hypothetical protein